MDGIHDLGGMQGFGPVEVEPDEPVFHQPWEGRVYSFAWVAGMHGFYNGGEFRHSIERMDPAHYLSSSYYEHWLTGISTLLVEKGLVGRDELEARAPGYPLSRPVVVDRLEAPGPDATEPAFGVGDRVVVRAAHPAGHTRCPRYVRGKRGTVVRVDGVHSLPDVEAHCDGKRQEPTYSVRFDAAELWGDGGNEVVHVDFWQSWLAPA